MNAQSVIRAFFGTALLATQMSVCGQAIDISGTVTDTITGHPISGAIVTLLHNTCTDTTDAAGAFRLLCTAASAVPVTQKIASKPYQLVSSGLEFNNVKKQFVSLRIYDLRGCAMMQLFDGMADAGQYMVKPSCLTGGCFIYSLRIGDSHYSIPFFNRGRVFKSLLAARTGSVPENGYLQKTRAVFLDTVCVTKAGYALKKVALSSPVLTGLLIALNPGIGVLTQERATPEQVGLYLPFSRAVDSLATATVQYRKVSELTWRVAHPLVRIYPDWVEGSAPITPVDAFAGSIFDLTSGTAYEVMVTISEPGSAAIVYSARCSTRALPSAAPAPTVTATPADNLQQKFTALRAGDVLLLSDGIYNVQNLQFNSDGTEAQPIYVKGASRNGVIIKDSSGTILQILKASHVVFENFTLQGSGVDDGTNAGCRGISFWNGEVQEYVTFRNLTINGTDMGIVAWGTINNVLVYNCVLNGNDVWTKAFVESNLTWNDDGIRLPGEGNCAFENTLHGFGDAFAVTDGVFSAAVHFYRNLVTMTGDDAFEADYGTRNIGFYDNYITNSSTFLSEDPLWGGPLYCFRNTMINTVRGPFKLNNTNSGFLIYNNTIIRTDGTTNWGWVQYNNGALRNWAYRNNILIYRGTGNLLAIESTVNNPIDFTNNAWYPDKAVWWTNSGGFASSMALVRNQLPATKPMAGSSTKRHENDVITTSNPFISVVTLGSDHLTEITTVYTPTPAAGSAIKNTGAPIPGITDGYSGVNPDMGSLIAGRTTPLWGAH